jgi:hypothetical protein
VTYEANKNQLQVAPVDDGAFGGLSLLRQFAAAADPELLSSFFAVTSVAAESPTVHVAYASRMRLRDKGLTPAVCVNKVRQTYSSAE